MLETVGGCLGYQIDSCKQNCAVVLAVRLFFFQAEDGMRDVAVTGVQTCALPICQSGLLRPRGRADQNFAAPGQAGFEPGGDASRLLPAALGQPSRRIGAAVLGVGVPPQNHVHLLSALRTLTPIELPQSVRGVLSANATLVKGAKRWPRPTESTESPK